MDQRELHPDLPKTLGGGVSSSPNKPLSDYLSRGYVPPYGTGVSPESFFVVPNGWEATARNENGAVVSYAISLVREGKALLTVNGKTQTFVDPHSHISSGPVAAVGQWFDFVARQDAAGERAARKNPFGAEDEDPASPADDAFTSLIKGAKSDVVSRSDFSVATQNFPTPSDLANWFSKVLERSTVAVEVMRLHQDAPHFLRPHSDNRLAFGSFKDDELGSWATTLFTYPVEPKFWWKGQVPGGHELAGQSCTMRMSGSQILSSHAFAIPYSDLVGTNAVGADAESDFGESDYWVAWVVGTDYAMVFPHNHSHARVDVDDGGSLVRITFRSIEKATSENAAEDAYLRSWGAWLDGDRVLSEGELEGEARAVERAFELEVYREAAEIHHEGTGDE